MGISSGLHYQVTAEINYLLYKRIPHSFDASFNKDTNKDNEANKLRLGACALGSCKYDVSIFYPIFDPQLPW